MFVYQYSAQADATKANISFSPTTLEKLVIEMSHKMFNPYADKNLVRLGTFSNTLSNALLNYKSRGSTEADLADKAQKAYNQLLYLPDDKRAELEKKVHATIGGEEKILGKSHKSNGFISPSEERNFKGSYMLSLEQEQKKPIRKPEDSAPNLFVVFKANKNDIEIQKIVEFHASDRWAKNIRVPPPDGTQ